MTRMIFINKDCRVINDYDLEQIIAIGKIAAYCKGNGWVKVKRVSIHREEMSNILMNNRSVYTW